MVLKQEVSNDQSCFVVHLLEAAKLVYVCHISY